jgi:hypothetical protein
MSPRSPGKLSQPSVNDDGFDALGYEILAEKAVSLGRAGRRAELSLAKLRDQDGKGDERRVLVHDAAEAVYAYFIQRELCGFCRHDDVIREFAIPKEVLARLGAK